MAGWICFGVGVIVLFVPLPTWFIYGPLFLASFILSIIAMAQGRLASGLILLLANLGVPVLYVIALVFGLATWGTALREMAVQSQRSHASMTNAASSSPAPKITSANEAPQTKVPASTPTFEKIEGAFSRKLGETFSPLSAIDTSSLTDGTPMYEFNAANGLQSFDHYYVLITPATHKIYSIWATGSFDNTETAKKEQAVVIEMLQQKYGPPAEQGIDDVIDNAEKINQGNRYVMTRIDGLVEATLTLRYNDTDLEKLAEQERIAGAVQNTDKTGL